MGSNVIDFSKLMPHKQAGIDTEAAKNYFIREVLPYICMTSLQRLITANASDNPQLVRLEMMRVFVESQLMKPAALDENSLKNFFAES